MTLEILANGRRNAKLACYYLFGAPFEVLASALLPLRARLLFASQVVIQQQCLSIHGSRGRRVPFRVLALSCSSNLNYGSKVPVDGRANLMSSDVYVLRY